MAITNFTELKAAILDYSTRTDLTTQDDDFVLLTEARLNYGSDDPVFPTPPLRVRQMQQRSTATVSAEFLELPGDFLEAIDFQLNTTPKCDLEYVTPEIFDTRYDTSITGRPSHFTIVGNEFRFYPSPSGSNTAELLYYKKIPDLATNSTNWLLAAYPNIYLYGGLLELSIYVQADADVQKYGRLFSGSLKGMSRSGRDSKYMVPLRARNDVRPPSSRKVRV